MHKCMLMYVLNVCMCMCVCACSCVCKCVNLYVCEFMRVCVSVYRTTVLTDHSFLWCLPAGFKHIARLYKIVKSSDWSPLGRSYGQLSGVDCRVHIDSLTRRLVAPWSEKEHMLSWCFQTDVVLHLRTLHWCYWVLRVTPWCVRNAWCPLGLSLSPFVLSGEGTIAPGDRGQGKTVLTHVGTEKGCASPLGPGVIFNLVFMDYFCLWVRWVLPFPHRQT